MRIEYLETKGLVARSPASEFIMMIPEECNIEDVDLSKLMKKYFIQRQKDKKIYTSNDLENKGIPRNVM